MAISTLSKLTVPLNSDQSSSTQGLLMPKLKYRFRVTLENFGFNTPTTELTKQVQDITRPTVSFDPITIDVYNSRVYLAGKHTWAPISISVRDEVTGVVSKLFGEQLQKQFDFFEQASAASGIDYKFLTRIEILDGGNGQFEPSILETWELYGCYLENVNYQNLAYSENAPVMIQGSIKYDNAVQTPKDSGVGTNVGRGTNTMSTGAGLRTEA
jgi:hypothetical protein